MSGYNNFSEFTIELEKNNLVPMCDGSYLNAIQSFEDSMTYLFPSKKELFEEFSGKNYPFSVDRVLIEICKKDDDVGVTYYNFTNALSIKTFGKQELYCKNKIGSFINKYDGVQVCGLVTEKEFIEKSRNDYIDKYGIEKAMEMAREKDDVDLICELYKKGGANPVINNEYKSKLVNEERFDDLEKIVDTLIALGK